MCHRVLPFSGCTCSTMLLRGTTTNTVSQSPLLLLCQTVPVISTYLLYHMFTYGHINLSQNKPHLSKNLCNVRVMLYPRGRSVTCIASVLFNGGDRETNEWRSQNKRLVASSPIIQLSAARDWINGSSCGAFIVIGKINLPRQSL